MHLVLFSTSGNQAYIFASNRLREAVGASHLLARSTTDWVEETLDDTGGTLLQASSGSTLAVVPDREAARTLARAVTGKALREAPGLGIHAVSIEIDGQDPTAANVDAVFAEYHRHVAVRPSTAARHQRVPVVAACDSTDLPASSWHADFDAELYGEADADLRPRPLSAEVIAKRNARPAARTELGGKLAMEPTLYGRELVHLHRFFDEVEWVGVVHADGNRLGEFFRAAVTEFGADTGAVSKQVQMVADEAFRSATSVLTELVKQSDRLPLVPLIIAGDDLTVLLDGALALAFVERYLATFAARSVDEPLIRRVLERLGWRSLTASAGIAVVKPHFPFSVAYRLCEQLCAGAKTLARSHPGTHGLDMHVLIDSRVTDLEAIRGRYVVAHEHESVVLTERPFLIGTDGVAPPADRDWAAARERLRVIRAIPRGGDGVLVTRTQLHALRDELRREPGRARRRLADLDNKVPPTGDDRERLDTLRGVDGLATGLLDLLELNGFVCEVAR